LITVSQPGRLRHPTNTNPGMNHIHTPQNSAGTPRRYRESLLSLAAMLVFSTAAAHADLDQVVADTHAASLELREQSLRKTISKDTCWPSGTWGDNLWTLAALYLNEKVDPGNARLLKHANDYIDMTRKRGTTPA
jgi:hypothetical protein